MSTEEPLREISGYPVKHVPVGKYTFGYVEINKDVSVIFRMRGEGPDLPDPNCTACKISKISECANEVCPPIKNDNPNASCSDAISACADRACLPECSGSAFGGGNLLIIA